MQWGGADYTLWGVTESVEGGVTEEKEVTQDFELSVRSADAETARHDVKESVAYDDEYGFYVCDMDLDEDETAQFIGGRFQNCPYYRPGDEYTIVRKQI